MWRTLLHYSDRRSRPEDSTRPHHCTSRSHSREAWRKGYRERSPLREGLFSRNPRLECGNLAYMRESPFPSGNTPASRGCLPTEYVTPKKISLLATSSYSQLNTCGRHAISHMGKKTANQNTRRLIPCGSSCWLTYSTYRPIIALPLLPPLFPPWNKWKCPIRPQLHIHYFVELQSMT